MSDKEIIIASEDVKKDTPWIPLLKELIVWWSKLVWVVIRAFTVMLPARIRRYRWKQYIKHRQQSLNNA